MRKIINDPVFGFINIPQGLLYDIVKHPLMQRLTRIKQLGMASVVYPGAQHTRFQHSLGAFHLMTGALSSMQEKGVFIFDSEAEAVKAAILMHDIGHGPFSHVLEHTLVKDVDHEDISLMMMDQINKDMGGRLNLAISIFKNKYPKQFFHQLISSQLDMDRLDYLRRDCFFTGVTEANIGSDRIIKMLNVRDDNLVVDYKGLYSIENFLTSRRLMYWSVYLHKTTVACEKTLVCALKRAKMLARRGQTPFAPPALDYFLRNDIDATHFQAGSEALNYYEELDDNDIWSAMKVWKHSDDKVLAMLATDLLNRNIFRVEESDQPASEEHIEEVREILMKATGVSREDTEYLMTTADVSKDLYDKEEDSIKILYKNEEIKDILDVSQLLNIALLSKKNYKYFFCFHRI